MTERATSLLTIDEDECWELLSAHTLGLLAFVTEDGQQLVSANFVVIDRYLYFRTEPDSVIAELAAGHNDVAFAVLYEATSYPSGWNVTVRGSAEQVRDADVEATVLSHPRLHPWAGGKRDLVIALTPRIVAGRRARRRT